MVRLEDRKMGRSQVYRGSGLESEEKQKGSELLFSENPLPLYHS